MRKKYDTVFRFSLKSKDFFAQNPQSSNLEPEFFANYQVSHCQTYKQKPNQDFWNQAQ